MTISLRTRLYLVVIVILAVSITVSAMLSRQATLFELRNEKERRATPAEIAAAAARVQETVTRDGESAIADALEVFRKETRRGFLLADAHRLITLTSNPRVVGATAEAVTDDTGAPGLRIDMSGGGQVMLRNVPVFDIRLGSQDARLFALANPGVPSQKLPSWLLGASATGVVALIFMVGLARRILRPVGALTDAARRMERGDLEVRVDVRGNDEIAELARGFNSMTARLAENERLRRQMVSDVAHELRSPVTNLRCLLEGVQDGLERLDSTTVAALYDETMFLQRLIADLQELTLAEAGMLTLHVRPIEGADVIGRAVASYTAVPGGAPLVVDVPASLPCRADPERLEQVLRNLLTNARQHTPVDRLVQVRAARAGDQVEIEVADTGMGIAAEHVPHIFERFYRADASRSRTTGGAGLGLAIVRQLVAAQGGTVSVTSDGLNRGARFRITLPAASPNGE
jgi:signal transduction histidine kinase